MTRRNAVRVWDLPTRLFHWSLAAGVVAAFATIYAGALDWHFRIGYALLALLLFRVMWGFAGAAYARFAAFPPSLRTALAYLRGDHAGRAGHNPLGAFAVYAFLLVLITQAVLGLFANDGSFSEGPLAQLVAGATSNLATRLHKWNQWLIVALVTLHLAAIAWHHHVKGEPLIRAMLHGDHHAPADRPVRPARDDGRMRLRAVILLAISAGLVSYLVKL